MHATTTAFPSCLGQRIAKRAYIDGSHKWRGACKAMGIMPDVAAPHRPQTNGVAEMAVRRVFEGTRAVLLASGLPHRRWADVARCCCFSRNARGPADKDFAPHQLCHKAELKGSLISFGALVH